MICIDRHIDRSGPVDLVLFILLLEQLDLNLNVMKGHTEFWGKLLVLYCTICYIPLTKRKFPCKFVLQEMLISEPLIYLQYHGHWGGMGYWWLA